MLDQGTVTLNNLYELIEKTHLRHLDKELHKEIASLFMDYKLRQEASHLFSVLVKHL